MWLFRLGVNLTAFLAALLASSARLAGAPPALVELQVGDKKFEGKIIAHSDAAIWLVGQEGRLRGFEPNDISKFRQVSPQFRGWNPSIVKDQLRREFGRPFEAVSTRHYVVVAVGDAQARLYADTLERFFGTFQMYFSLRGFKVPEPEFPLVAIIFPNQGAFMKYAQQENQRMSKQVRGYYMPSTNRICFFESPGDTASLDVRRNFVTPFSPGGRRVGDEGDANLEVSIFDFEFDREQTRPILPILRQIQNPKSAIRNAFTLTPDPSPIKGEGGSEITASGLIVHFPIANVEPSPHINSIEASLKDTLIHEATHQAAYNTGLHSRIGENPLWMVEGLATVIEAPGMRDSRANSGMKSRINRERMLWFGNFAKERRKAQSLEAFIASNDLFHQNVLDAYSQAWALTFFLFETRPRNYADYLRSVASRDPLLQYGPEARVADFRKAIGKELKLLEAEFLRFMNDLK